MASVKTCIKRHMNTAQTTHCCIVKNVLQLQIRTPETMSAYNGNILQGKAKKFGLVQQAWSPRGRSIGIVLPNARGQRDIYKSEF